MRQSSAMSSPHDYRELMRASTHFNDDGRSVEQVLAAQKARANARSAKGRKKGSKAAPTKPTHGVVRPAALQELDRIRAAAAEAKARLNPEPPPKPVPTRRKKVESPRAR